MYLSVSDYKNSLNFEEILRDNGIITKGNNIPIKCPLCGHNDCFTYTNIKKVYRCYSCNNSGDEITLLSKLRNIKEEDLIKENVDDKKTISFTEKKQQKEFIFKYSELNLSSIEFLQNRGISIDTQKHFNLKTSIIKDSETNSHLNYLSFPIYDINNNIVSYKLRCITNKKKMYTDNKNKVKKYIKLFGIQNIVDHEEITITEGEIDSISMYQLGFNNITSILTGGSGFTKILNDEQTLDFLTKFKKIKFFRDNDNTGKENFNKMKAIIYNKGLFRNNLIYDICLKTYKDCNDLLKDKSKADEEKVKLINLATKIIDIENECNSISMEGMRFEYKNCFETKNGFYPMPIYDNFPVLLEKLGVTEFYYDEIKKKNFIYKGDQKINNENILIAEIRDLSKRIQMNMNKDDIVDCFDRLCQDNKKNLVKDYILESANKYESQRNKFVSEMPNLKEISKYLIHDQNLISENAKSEFLLKWFLNSLCALFSIEGHESHGVLVLQGKQGVGKTRFFKNLLPKKLLKYNYIGEGKQIDTSSKDNLEELTSYFIAELGEIASTLKKGMDELKNHITKSSDTYRSSYARKNVTYPRRHVYCGSVNEEQFLKDDTGNRRFWVIPVLDIKHDEFIEQFNLESFWAEIYFLYQKYQEIKDEEKLYKNTNIRPFFLYNEIQDLVEKTSKNMRVKTNMQDRLESVFDWKSEIKLYYTSNNIFEILSNSDYKNNKDSTVQIGRELNKMEITREKGSSNKMYYILPPVKSEVQSQKEIIYNICKSLKTRE